MFLSFGSLNYDLVYNVEHFVRPGETVISHAFGRFCGGKGLNESIALARAGATVFHAGMAGSDGAELVELLEKNGVDVSLLGHADCENGHAVIQIDADGQNSIITHAGSNGRITGEYIQSVLAHFGKNDVLVLQNEINMTDKIVDAAKERGMTVVFNPSPLNERIFHIDLEKIDWFIVNEIEGEFLSGKKSGEEIVTALKAKYPGAKILLTLVGDGAIYYDGEAMLHEPAYPCEVVDTTGAGDTFSGYFFACFMNGSSPAAAMKTAARAAAMAVSTKGASNSIPYMKDISKP